MVESIAIKYRAFLSYSHSDAAWGKWLHSALEGYRIDKDLAGRTTALGPVPQTLRPIFRDREEFSGGHTLSDATVAALDASSALIVLCSTIAASRPAVNEEVRLFRSRHPARPVIPVIIEGAWPDNAPPALRYELASDGTVTDRPITILGPDLRDSGDGKSLGLAKVVAGLIGVGSDDIFRRADRTRRRQVRLRNGVVGAIAALMASAGFFAWQTHHTRQALAERQSTLAEIEALVAKYTPSGANQTPGAGEGLTAAITAIANGAATDARYAMALELLKAGKPAEAEPLLKAVADEIAARARNDAKQAAEAYRNLGAIAGIADPKRAREYYGRALEFDPDNVNALYWAGWFEKRAGNLNAAEQIYRRLIALKADAPDSREVYWARLGVGDIRFARGDIGAAMSEYRGAQAITERAAKADPGNVEWQRDLSVSYDKVGDVLVAQGKLAEALTAFRDSLAIAERLAKADPGNVGWQHDLSVSYERVGGALVAQGKLAEALASFQNSLAIAERLAKADPGNAGWQRGLSVSYEKVGDVLVVQGRLAEALTAFRDSLAIRERLAKADPGNAGWQRDLSVSYSKVGDVLVAQGNLAEALASFRDSLAIKERLARADPGNAGWQRDLSVSYERVGEVLVAQGKLAEALTAFRDSLAIRERLAKLDPGNASWQRDLSVSYERVGGALVAQGNLAEALTAFRDSLAIAERLAKADPGNAQWRWDLVVAHAKLAMRGDEPAQRWAFIVAELRRLRDENRLRPAWARLLPLAEAELAKHQEARAAPP